MKLRTRFIILLYSYCIMFALIGISISITDQQIRELGDQEQRANAVIRGGYELSHLSNNFLFHPGEKRQNLQWKSQFILLSGDVANLNPGTPDEQTLTMDISDKLDHLSAVYTQSVATIEGAHHSGQSIRSELIQVVWSRFVVQNQGMIYDALRLSEILHSRK
jgi:hypothetical protein